MLFSKLLHIFKRRSSSPTILRDLPSAEVMRQFLDRERARADRSGVGFALLQFTPRDINTAQDTLVHLVRTLKVRLRSTDEIGWVSPHQIGAVLLFTTVQGARSVAHEVCRSFDQLTPPQCDVFYYPTDYAEPAVEQQNGSAHHPRNGSSGQNGNGVVSRPTADRPVEALEPLFVQPTSFVKRTIDILGALVAIALASPLMLAAAIAVKLTSPGPIFYKQLRAGRGGKQFFMYKFRTMQVDADSLKDQLLAQNEMDGPAFKIKKDPRVTRIGRFLRRTSIDELPQLFHVLSGQMSLVGPRAMAWHEAVVCQQWQRRRLDVTPGITGIWQVYGRARVSFDQWMRMDLQYVDTASVPKDIKLLAATVPAVMFGQGAY